ncbi:glycosyl transferase [Caldovatus sediminis]|uniref:Glycosyl transferase n=1 Tax=Caldovatus sediminis TaxID=2041189 RepID=A0A8J2ZDS3_9PROT|nr:glycosyltransferase family 39 protein [Caldovatus sediminis]GGG45667.1 glycosyl transferase [Caldovatus sediminis]
MLQRSPAAGAPGEAGPPSHPLAHATERRPRLCLVLLCLALWLPGFFTLPPTDRDESRFAQATRQMVETGDYVRIRFGEVERNKKPAGIHWAQAASVHAAEALGLATRDAIWPYRLPSLLGALLAVLATHHFGRALVGRRAAFLGAALLASCLVLAAETHIAKTDAALLASVVVAMGLFGRAYLRPEAFGAPEAAGFWLALGLGILLKGPVAPMVPLLAGITLAVADRGAPWLRALRPGWGAPLMLLAAAPWFVAIGIATDGRFFAEAVGGDMLAKVGSGEESHWGPPGYYLLTFGIAAFPAGWVVLRALPGAWHARARPATRFLLAWIVPVWLLFEAVATKLPHYTLPAFPALMLLAGAWATDPLRARPPRWLAWLADAGFVAVALALALLAPALTYALTGGVEPVALLALPAAGVLVWGAFAARARKGEGEAAAPARPRWDRAGLAAAGLAVPLYAVVLEGVLPRLEPIWIAPRVAAALRAAPGGGPPAEAFGIVGFHEPSLVFAVGTRTRLLRDGAAAARFLAEGEAQGGARVVAVGDRDEAAFRDAAAALGLELAELGSVAGLNPTRGRWLALTLYRLAGT